MRQELPPRDSLLALSDRELLGHCRVDRYRGTGRGGQKRNTTESAVRLTLADSGVVSTCDATRSQQKNVTIALRKLRREIALRLRSAPRGTLGFTGRPGQRDRGYAVWMARVLDALEAAGYRVGEAAAALGGGTARLVRDLASDPGLWQAVNDARLEAGLTPLRRP